ncbi:hypothetical protein GCM10027280_42360 [Micromonospora polyrhachis]|uniref:Uncharacterized protein n=1 Tax=Micromonospora polyrhachis TaxID=1282883 RepID=A0A7W7SXC6_9ACTN|nr:hypothetical protein [Micromonospora polyrhachis]
MGKPAYIFRWTGGHRARRGLRAVRQPGRRYRAAAIVDGVTALSTQVHALRQLGRWQDPRGVNLLDGGAPFYDTYECADGRHIAVGALEPRLYAELVRRTGFEPATGGRGPGPCRSGAMAGCPGAPGPAVP